MSIYLVVKSGAKRTGYVCQTNNLSPTLDIPGEYNQITYDNTNFLFNMNSEQPMYKVIYNDSEGSRYSAYICGSSFNDVINSLGQNYGIYNITSLVKTNYVWYNIN